MSEIDVREGQIGPRDAELQSLINVRNWFLLNILRMDGQNSTKFCIHMIIDKIYIDIVNISGNEDIQNISDEFEIWPGWTKDCGVNCT